MSDRQDKQRRRQARVAAQDAGGQRVARRLEVRLLGATILTLAAIALVVVFAVSGRKDNSTVARVTPAAPLHGVPRQIAANRTQANRIVDGSIADKLASLRGVPVVVNQWASWCPSCKAEFGFFQRLAHSYSRRVAFVGLDSQDRRADAQAFLRTSPVPYPSIYDPSAGEARSIGGGQGWPTTFFYDRTGRQTYVRQGGYTTLAALKADIERYALGRSQ